MLTQVWIDESKCAKLIMRLDNYRRRWDRVNAMWMNEHVHDEASHGADAFRTFCIAINTLGSQTEWGKPINYKQQRVI